jgi:hypothetical protein
MLDGGARHFEIAVHHDEADPRPDGAPVGLPEIALDHEPPVDAWAEPELLVTVGAVDAADDEVEVEGVAVADAVSVELAAVEEPEPSVVTSATSAELVDPPSSVIAAVQPRAPVAAIPRAVVPMVIRRRRRLARARASTRGSVVFMRRCCGTLPFESMTWREAPFNDP